MPYLQSHPQHSSYLTAEFLQTASQWRMLVLRDTACQRAFPCPFLGSALRIQVIGKGHGVAPKTHAGCSMRGQCPGKHLRAGDDDWVSQELPNLLAKATAGRMDGSKAHALLWSGAVREPLLYVPLACLEQLEDGRAAPAIPASAQLESAGGAVSYGRLQVPSALLAGSKYRSNA